MTTYRVTYVDSVLREAIVEAENPDQAETVVRQQMENVGHHHAVDAWNEDWQAQPRSASPILHPCCFECGQETE